MYPGCTIQVAVLPGAECPAHGGKVIISRSLGAVHDLNRVSDQGGDGSARAAGHYVKGSPFFARD
jgi:hypothetical protein